VVPRLTAIEAAKRIRQTDALIDPKLGRQICLREDYAALLTGNLTKVSGKYHVEMAVTQSKSGSTIFRDGESFQSPVDLYPALDRLTLNLRRRLGEPPSKLEKTKALAL